MGAPTSGSSGSSSASAVPGYYPDPSIPHYIRYWNGSAWVPGTSRPAPAAGEPLTAPPGAPAPVPAPASAYAPAPVAAPGMDESGPMYLDEDPRAPVADLGASAAPAPVAAPAPAPVWPRAAGSGGPGAEPPRISWGAAVPEQQAPPGTERPVPQDQPHAQDQPYARSQSQPYAESQAHAEPQSPPRTRPQPDPVSPPQPRPAAPAPWAEQVQHLARQSEGERPPAGRAPQHTRPAPSAPAEEKVTPWRPPVEDPFLSMVTAQGRPGSLVRRFAARVLDTALFCAVTATAAVPLGSAAYHHVQDKVDSAEQTGETVKVWLIDGTTGTQVAGVLLVALLAGLLLEVLPTVKWGRTLGKKLVGLRVLDVESQQPPGFGASMRRWLTHTVLDALVIGVLGLAWCLFDRPWRQCWHDKAARTFVAAV